MALKVRRWVIEANIHPYFGNLKVAAVTTDKLKAYRRGLEVFHHLRRTVLRNMRRAAVPHVVRMRITGHRTNSIKLRYNIGDIDDIRLVKEFDGAAVETI